MLKFSHNFLAKLAAAEDIFDVEVLVFQRRKPLQLGLGTCFLFLNACFREQLRLLGFTGRTGDFDLLQVETGGRNILSLQILQLPLRLFLNFGLLDVEAFEAPVCFKN